MFSLIIILYFFFLLWFGQVQTIGFRTPHLKRFHLELTLKMVFWFVKIIYMLMKNWDYYFCIFFHLWLSIIALASKFCQICFPNSTDVWHWAGSRPDASDPICYCRGIHEILGFYFPYPPVKLLCQYVKDYRERTSHHLLKLCQTLMRSAAALGEDLPLDSSGTKLTASTGATLVVSDSAGFEADHRIYLFDSTCDNLLMLCPGVSISWKRWEFSSFQTDTVSES